MDSQELKPIVESLIFVSEEPIDEATLLTVLEGSGVDRETLHAALVAILTAWNEHPASGLQLVEVAGGYQFRTKESCAPWIKALNIPKATRLSPASLETLAVVAYRQPCMRSEIEGVRGVDCGGVLKTLLERRLIRIVGRRDEAGQPLVYGTSKEFLELFNLRDLKELPPLKDIQELILKNRVQTEVTPTAAAPSAGDDEEEPTDVIEDEDDDEETDEEDHEGDEAAEAEALSQLENRLKDLREVERAVLATTPLAEETGDGTSAARARSGAAGATVPAGHSSGEASQPDETPAVDRRVE